MKELITRYRRWAGIAAAMLVGVIFFLAGLGKVQQTEAFMIVFGLDRALLAPTLANHIDSWLPRLELALGLLLVVGIATKLVAVLACALIAAFIFNNSWEVARGAVDNPCGCFGSLGNTFPLSFTQALYLDIAMLAMVVVILFWYPGNWLSARPWFLRRW